MVARFADPVTWPVPVSSSAQPNAFAPATVMALGSAGAAKVGTDGVIAGAVVGATSTSYHGWVVGPGVGVAVVAGSAGSAGAAAAGLRVAYAARARASIATAPTAVVIRACRHVVGMPGACGACLDALCPLPAGRLPVWWAQPVNHDVGRPGDSRDAPPESRVRGRETVRGRRRSRSSVPGWPVEWAAPG